MDPETKAELAGLGVQVFMPVVQAGAKYYFSKKEMKAQRDFRVEMAERRSNRAKNVAEAFSGGSAQEEEEPGQQAYSPQPQRVQNVGQRIQQLRQSTNCSFCLKALDTLEDSDPETARHGLAEVEHYLNEKQRLLNSEATEAQVQQELSSVVEKWDVLPELMVDDQGGSGW